MFHLRQMAEQNLIFMICVPTRHNPPFCKSFPSLYILISCIQAILSEALIFLHLFQLLSQILKLFFLINGYLVLDLAEVFGCFVFRNFLHYNCFLCSHISFLFCSSLKILCHDSFSFLLQHVLDRSKYHDISFAFGTHYCFKTCK